MLLYYREVAKWEMFDSGYYRLFTIYRKKQNMFSTISFDYIVINA